MSRRRKPSIDKARKMQIIAQHERMVRNVFLNVELMLNDNIRELSEYDIQGLLFLAFRTALANTDAHADREKSGKVDCVVFEGAKPRVFYEIKTYFKDHEKVRKKDFDHDLEKIRNSIKAHPGARGFFFMAGAKAKFTDSALSEFPFVKRHLNQQDRTWVKYQLTSGGTLRLRPSQKQHHGRSVVVTWEVKV